MITIEDLEEAIAECQGQRNPNAITCYKLASYYTILDPISEVKKEEPVRSHSLAPPPTDRVYYESDTEFGNKVQNMDINDVLAVMDELMETLAVINPRLYNGVMRKL